MYRKVDVELKEFFKEHPRNAKFLENEMIELEKEKIYQRNLAGIRMEYPAIQRMKSNPGHCCFCNSWRGIKRINLLAEMPGEEKKVVIMADMEVCPECLKILDSEYAEVIEENGRSEITGEGLSEQFQKGPNRAERRRQAREEARLRRKGKRAYTKKK